MPSPDADDLSRFVLAQGPVYDRALAELVAGEKRSHWMWFVFPQLRGLGNSETAQRYGLATLDDARAYLAHPVLGPRLIACTQAVLRHEGQPLRAIFGSPDDMKFRSSMTLFARAAGDGGSIFHDALTSLCGGEEDVRTNESLARSEPRR